MERQTLPGSRRAGGWGRTYLLAWLALAGCLLIFAFAEYQGRTIHQQAQRAEVQSSVGLIRSRLEGRINADVQLARGLVAVLSADPGMSQAEFSTLATHTIDGRDGFINMAVAPGLVVSMVYPLDQNRAVLGLNYNLNEAQRKAALRVRDSGEMVLAGPVNLVQGGTGFIGRFPIFVGDGDSRRFWGILSAVLDVPSIYRASGLMSDDHGLDVALRGPDGTGEAGAVFFGDAAVFASDPVLVDIVLPVGTWQMAARPAGGWTAVSPKLWGLRALLALMTILVVVPTYQVCRMSEHRNTVIEALTWREQELEASREELDRLSTVARYASDSVVITDRDAKITWVNPAFTETTGYTAAEALGRTTSELLNGPNTDPATIERIRDHLVRGARLSTEILNRHKDGHDVWIQTQLVPVLGDDGTVSHVIGVERDISVQKAHAAELAEAKLAAERADRAKSEFLANTSHEIRTPMNGIIGMAEVLSESDLAPDSQEQVRIILDSAQSLLQIINDILDLSRLESGRFEIADEDFDLRACVEGAVDLIRPTASAKGLDLRLEFDPNLPAVVRSDDGRLRQILLNLMGNAVKFTAQGSVELRVRAGVDDPYRLSFDVIDTGEGLSEEQQTRIFDRFSQADAGITRKFGGTGLGLAITRCLAQEMGGGISVHSALGDGSCFTVVIQSKGPAAPVLAPENTVTADLSVLSGRTILLAEDNRTNRVLVHKFLEGLGVTIQDAENGRIAVDLCRAQVPDLILMDMSMPELDGISATQEIRALPGPQPAIIALTANAFESDRKACRAAGMDGFLSKPLRKKDLLLAISAMLEQRVAA